MMCITLSFSPVVVGWSQIVDIVLYLLVFCILSSSVMYPPTLTHPGTGYHQLLPFPW